MRKTINIEDILSQPRWKVFFLLAFLIYGVGSNLLGQELTASRSARILAKLKTATQSNELLSPTLLKEPTFTQGTNNNIWFKLPPLDSVAKVVAPEDIDVYAVLISIDQFTRALPVSVSDSTDTTAQSYDVGPLVSGTTYAYSLQLYIEPQIGPAIKSPFSETTSSTQDTAAPIVPPGVVIPQDTLPVPLRGWLKENNFEVSGDVKDQAGVWQAKLYRRKLGQATWDSVGVMTSTGDSTAVGFVFPDSVQAKFSQGLEDGEYEFRIDGRDATHAPESAAPPSEGPPPSFRLGGNETVPEPSDTAHVRINIDTTPPDPVTLLCRPVDAGINLTWNAAIDSGVGVDLYRILRNGQILDTVEDTDTMYLDSAFVMTMAHQFEYQVLPVDSLGNEQTAGGKDTCEFVPTATITMLDEPEYTKGDSNLVCWTTLNPGLFESYTVLVDDEDDATPTLTLRVDTLCVLIDNLEEGVKYSYSVVGTDTVGRDEPSVNVVSSTQDSTQPNLESAEIPELDSTPVDGWLNSRTFQVNAALSDPAGVWKAKLYRRDKNEPPNDWEEVDVIEDLIDLPFLHTVPDDGEYEFRVEGVDSTYTPESHDSDFELAGNEHVPTPSDPAHVAIKIDSTGPTGDFAFTDPTGQDADSTRLTWQPAEDAGVGLAIYEVTRVVLPDNTDMRMWRLPMTQTSLVDSLLDVDKSDTDTLTLYYRVAAIDRLSNETSIDDTLDHIVRPPDSRMFMEPRFTKGDSNEVFWSLEKPVKHYEVQKDTTSDFTGGDALIVEYPITIATFRSLEDGQIYYYRVRHFDLEDRYSDWSPATFSTQDATAPMTREASIPDAQEHEGWLNSRTFTVAAVLSDPAGIWKAKLYRRPHEENQDPRVWTKVDSVEGMDNVSFLHTVPDDGEYEFRVEGVDSTYTPESRGLERELAGNEHVPDPSDLAHAVINIDTTPPDGGFAFTAATGQTGENIFVQWIAADDGDGIGLERYVLTRTDLENGDERTEVFRDSLNTWTLPDTLEFVDSFFDNQDHIFQYRLTAFDSLDNSSFTESTVEYTANTPPNIILEPKFTPGVTNTIRWGNPNAQVVVSIAEVATDESFSTPARLVTDADFATFGVPEPLANHQKYYYRVRNVNVFSDTSDWSATTFSTQDSVRPRIDGVSVENGHTTNDNLWVFEKDARLQFQASDEAPGEIWRYLVYENTMPGDTIGFSDLRSMVSENVPHTLSACDNSPTDLCFRVFDGAGNQSDSLCITIVCQEDSVRPLFAFPNPYNPMNGDMMTIRCLDQTETEIRIFDFFGNPIRRLTDKVGGYDFLWDGRNGKGEMVANGVYVCIGKESRARFKIGVKKQSSN